LQKLMQRWVIAMRPLRRVIQRKVTPQLPVNRLVLLRNPQQQSPVSETLAGYIVDGFRL